MGESRSLEVFDCCREFGASSFERRAEVAGNFVRLLVTTVAPPKDLDRFDREWTRSIRTRVSEMCPLGCRAWPLQAHSPRGEFLVDFGWAEIEGGKRILLAGESEWGSVTKWSTHWRPVEHDFEKLLAFKSVFKVIVFSSNDQLADSDSGLDSDFSIGFAKTRIANSLAGYGHNIAGETHILLDFPRTGDPNSNGVYRSFFWTAKADGDADVRIEALEDGPLPRPNSS
jgi:hypothetical protein